ncbi:MAG: phosphoenolpyruvate carboxykinase (ATP) [Patescibacteria group bacterium]|nr:phosphoenolpyruvate carboxykinase (ATP) [Patescibacteria group bacterium]
MINLSGLGIASPKINHNFDVDALYNASLARGEAQKSATESLVVTTGKYTGRSPYDKFIVDTPDIHDEINWGDVNVPITKKNYAKLKEKITAHLDSRDELFVHDGVAGADPSCAENFRIICEYAYQALFIRHLLIRPQAEIDPTFTLLVAPDCKIENPQEYGLNSEAFIIVNFQEKTAIIGGSKYAGEIKKSIFSIMNYLLPKKGVLPMHCSANAAQDGKTALFFGLSGTGKTTLSADPNRKLIGDDEHGWSDSGIFNFEGGLYAKCINLKREKEPQIYDAIRKGTIVENVAMNEAGEFDFTDDSLTENTRAGFPIDYIPGHIEDGRGDHPSVIIFLTADAFGVMPPISKLTLKQAMYHFMSGYTSKLAGTERGITEPKAAFSSMFGKPFMPLPPTVYAKILGEKLEKHNTSVYLVNTGWVGGPYGVGKRIDIDYSRAMVSAALNGDLEQVEYNTHSVFNLEMPKSCPNVPAEVLNPRNTWEDKEAYDKKARELADLFIENCEKLEGVGEDIRCVGPVENVQ